MPPRDSLHRLRDILDATRDVPDLERMIGAALERAGSHAPGQADPGRPDG